MFDLGVILSGEIKRWSLLGVKGLKRYLQLIQYVFPHSFSVSFSLPHFFSFCLSHLFPALLPPSLSLVGPLRSCNKKYILKYQIALKGKRWLTTQIPNILCYSPPGNARRICARKYYNRCRITWVEPFVLYYRTVLVILKQLFTEVEVASSGYLPQRFAVREISTISHLHCSEELFITSVR